MTLGQIVTILIAVILLFLGIVTIAACMLSSQISQQHERDGEPKP